MGEFEKYFTEQGEVKRGKETALEMLKDREPLTKIMKYSKLGQEDILLLARENGLEVIDE